MTANALDNAYQYCLNLAQQHYENFPVASFALPKKLRKPIAVIYTFARIADDYADEGNHSPQTRLDLLDQHREKLNAVDCGNPVDDLLFIALDDVMKKHDLPINLFHNLITAFTQDVTKNRYQNYDEVLTYCRLSANPVGRLLLHLYGEANDKNLAHSDAICSALQLINFWQDLQQDYRESNRIYLPLDEMKDYGVSEDHLKYNRSDNSFQALMDMQITRTRKLMLSGIPLSTQLPGRLGFELRLTTQGGLLILDALDTQRNNVFARPRLSKRDWLKILGRAIFKFT